MLNWLIYNSVLPLLPVPLVWLGAVLVGGYRTVLSIIRDGQLCFYCTSLSAVAINDIVKSGDIHQNSSAILSVAGLILCMILSTFTYGVAVTAPPQSGAPAAQTEFKLGVTSLLTAALTTLIAALSRHVLGIV
jgi:hypothetical protein